MRLHSDVITRLDVEKAATLAGVDFTRFGEHGSRIRDHAFDVILTGSSPRRQNARGRDADYAATWDEWGVFLGHLFGLDPTMFAGSGPTYPTYRDSIHFDWATAGQYRYGASPQRHKLHRWDYSGEAVTGAYGVFECQCGALRRIPRTRDLDSILT